MTIELFLGKQNIFNIMKSNNIIHCFNGLKRKLLKLAQLIKKMDKIQSLNKIISRGYLVPPKIEDQNPKSTSDFIFCNETLRTFLLISGHKRRIIAITIFIQHFTGCLNQHSKARQWNK